MVAWKSQNQVLLNLSVQPKRSRRSNSPMLTAVCKPRVGHVLGVTRTSNAKLQLLNGEYGRETVHCPTPLFVFFISNLLSLLNVLCLGMDALLKDGAALRQGLRGFGILSCGLCASMKPTMCKHDILGRGAALLLTICCRYRLSRFSKFKGVKFSSRSLSLSPNGYSREVHQAATGNAGHGTLPSVLLKPPMHARVCWMLAFMLHSVILSGPSYCRSLGLRRHCCRIWPSLPPARTR